MDMIQRSFKALGIGSFIYLLVILYNNGNLIRSTSIIFVFGISICIGISSYIFDIESLNFLTCLIIHYVIVNTIVLIANKLLGFNGSYSELLISIFILYVLSYIITTLNTWMTAKQLNTLLKQVHHSLIP